MKVPMTPPALDDLRDQWAAERVSELLSNQFAPDMQYRHWATMRHLQPPQGLTSREWWFATRMARGANLRPLPLLTADGDPVLLAVPDAGQEMLHHIDQQAAGSIRGSRHVLEGDDSDRYVISSLMEEAISSSLLEGAATTRERAKELLRSGRPARTRGETMVRNNYEAMQLVRDNRDERLTPELVLRLHETITRDTLDDPTGAGRLQRPGEDRVVVATHDEVLHQPPPAEQLADRLNALCSFANGQQVGFFVHPVVRAVIVHYWLAHDHPFIDGNGRTARALFYWALLHRGYWLAEYLSISSLLYAAPAKYARAFLYVSTDQFDATYFLLNQLKIVRRSIDSLHAYLDRKARQLRVADNRIRATVNLNYRQRALLGHALRRSGFGYTFKSHAASHGVVYQSARTDLLDLAEKGLLEAHKVGRRHVFVAVDDLEQRLADLS
ncbi:MAG: Fic family protein [Acidimicrobiales bacterium]